MNIHFQRGRIYVLVIGVVCCKLLLSNSFRISVVCPDGWTVNPPSNSCLMSYSGPESWRDARKFCQENGSDLVTIDSEQENQIVHDMAKKAAKHHWIGVRHISSYDLSLETRRAQYVKWGEPTPRTPHVDGTCAMIPIDSDGSWGFDYCIREKKFICEKPGEIVMRPCLGGTYGEDCSKNCSLNCGGSHKACNSSTGRCVSSCAAGFQGGMCDVECANNTYGFNCSQTCSPKCAKTEDKVCNTISGECLWGCIPGYSGEKCDSECANNTYGLHCSEICNPNCAEREGKVCNTVSGKCLWGCAPGYSGDKCDSECANNTYGLHCSQACSPNCAEREGQVCSTISGECLWGCAPGYSGDKCDSGDETWFPFFIIPPKRLNRMWVDGQGDRPVLLRPGFQSRKRMFTAFSN
ncbi:multiple epidermal growth factor-like domains 11 [Elysia marginata]|uniref:Multiple epidermal growth factor-like domains 11 n=1 Tax=Elysia marginata TaxID=1093978 RepID=A0AAV4IQV6_9GAST|nr:multiple epidermal growth factor-like domains 11 [Elysia marginata]